MDCPTEEQTIRSRLGSVAGIDCLDFDLVRRELTLTRHLADEAPVLDALRSIGLPGEPISDGDETPKAWERRPLCRAPSGCNSAGPGRSRPRCSTSPPETGPSSPPSWSRRSRSVGKPKDGDTRARYVLLTVDPEMTKTDASFCSAEIKRVAYDVEEAAQAVEQSLLPDVFAQMLREAR